MLSILNLFIRSINLASKFILIIFLAKLLDAEEFGDYGLLSSLLNLSLYFIGLEFYTYSNREALINKTNYNNIITSHISLIGFTYLIVLPLFYLALNFSNLINSKYILLFFILIIFEHINQEIMRFLTILGRPILANLLFFIRSGLWGILVIIISFTYLSISLTKILKIWIATEVICLIFGLFYLFYKEKISLTLKEYKINWIIKGLTTCLPFMIGTISIRTIFTGDRYFIESYFTNEILSAYVLFSSIAVSILSFLDASVFSFLYPKLISYINNNDVKYKIIIQKLYRKTFLFLFLINIFFIILINPLLLLINKNEFYNHISYFYPILLAQNIYCLSMIPHYVLYAFKKDKYIIKSQVFTVILFFLIIKIFMTYSTDINIIFISLNISFLFLLLYKLFIARKCIKNYEYINIS